MGWGHPWDDQESQHREFGSASNWASPVFPWGLWVLTRKIKGIEQ